MEFRRSNEADINNIMDIIKEAQGYFKKQRIDQWQNNYPNPDTIRDDISNNYSYVLLKDNKIVGTAAISFDGEKTYGSIYNGQWISNNEYAVIHRIAVKSSYKGLGLASEIIKNVERICLDKDAHSIRIDTHKDNLSMQRLLQKNNFQYCGIIYLKDKSERMAFEKII